MAREHKKDSMGEEKNKTRKKIQWGEEENCCPKSRDDLSSLDFKQYIQESAEISLQTTTLYQEYYTISVEIGGIFFKYKIKNV